MEYEYVNKSEYRPMREELEQIINRVHKYMRKHHDTTFQHRLIGSGKRHLITRIKGGNTGYDFDYNLIVEAPIGFKWKEKVLKQHFRSQRTQTLSHQPRVSICLTLRR